MRSQGNPSQWREGYPPRDQIVAEIAAGFHSSCFCDGDLVGAFSFITGVDPTHVSFDAGACTLR